MSFQDVSHKVRRQKFLSFAVLLFTLSFGVLIGTVVNTSAKAAKDQVSVAPGATPLAIPSPVQLQNSFSTLAKMLEPSVVNISSEYIPSGKAVTKSAPQTRNRRQMPNQDEDQSDSMQEFMQRFFGQGQGQGGGGFGGMEQQDRRTAGLGSGVVVDKNGYILTNNHVVEHSTRLRVKFTNDSTEYPAKVIGTDTLTDLAVIKIEKTGLTPAKIGNSDAVQVGDWAVAIGSPFGFQATVTAGIVSAKQRSLESEENSPFQKFIQTDAAINPGNSGGPLLNINGEVIGINTMIASRSGGYQGIGFAMPINAAVGVYNSIIKNGHVTRGSIGIRFREADSRDLIKAYGGTEGVFVGEVTSSSPAEKAGMKEEDIITSVDGKPVRNGQDLIDTVSAKPVGSTVQVGILRGGKAEKLTVAVADRAKIAGAVGPEADNTENDAVEPTKAKFGMTLKNMNEALRQNTGYKGKGGVVIDSVEPGSFADDILLQKGDVIETMTSHDQHEAVNSAADVKRIQEKLKAGDIVAFKVQRSTGMRGGGWQTLFPAGTLPAQ